MILLDLSDSKSFPISRFWLLLLLVSIGVDGDWYFSDPTRKLRNNDLNAGDAEPLLVCCCCCWFAETLVDAAAAALACSDSNCCWICKLIGN